MKTCFNLPRLISACVKTLTPPATEDSPARLQLAKRPVHQAIGLLFLSLAISRTAMAATVTVSVGTGGNLVFTPVAVSIQPGDTVTWVWDSSDHNVQSGSLGVPSGLFNSGIRNKGATFSQTFPNAGTFDYYCQVHEACCNMEGRVVVTGTRPVFFTGEVPLGNGVFYLAFPGNGTFFGYYSYLSDPRFIFHFDLGYEYWFDTANGSGGIFFYDFASQGFFYTSPSFGFPYLYDFSLKAVLYYFPDTNNPGRYGSNPRYFFNTATGQIITK